MDFVVTALDFKDEDALERRQANREKHLKGLRTLADQGNFLSGGAILNNERKMIGSTAHVRFGTADDLWAWLDNDPYTTGRVWENIEVKEIARFPV